MNVYYMNEKLGDNTIIVHNTRPSEYQDLIEDYLLGGGLIHRIDEGVRSTSDSVPSGDDFDPLEFEIQERERENLVGGLFDKIEKLRDLERPIDEDFLDPDWMDEEEF
jgi:hypothetical protein